MRDLLTLAIAPSRPKVRRFRLLRPALLPLAAALLFAVTLSYVLVASPGASDSPIAVADLTPAATTLPAEPVADVFLHDRFEGAELHPVWKSADGSAGTTTLVDFGGRKALVLSAHPTWTPQQELKADWPSTPNSMQDAFGYSVAVSGDLIAVGAPIPSASVSRAMHAKAGRFHLNRMEQRTSLRNELGDREVTSACRT